MGRWNGNNAGNMYVCRVTSDEDEADAVGKHSARKEKERQGGGVKSRANQKRNRTWTKRERGE